MTARLLLIVFLLFGQATTAQTDEQIIERFEKKLWEKDDCQLDYYTYTPVQDKPEAGYPLILALHGTGEMIDLSGETSHLVRRELIKGWITDEVQEKYHPYILAPQTILDKSWMESQVYTAIDEIIKNLIEEKIIDKNRIYVIGHSIGGIDAWFYPTWLTNKPAAIAPMSAGWESGPENEAIKEASKNEFKDLAIWNFYHFSDPEGSVGAARGIIDTMKRQGLSFVTNHEPKSSNLFDQYIYTEYNQETLPCVGVECHRVCDLAIKDPIFIEWLFKQDRSKDSEPKPAPIRITSLDTMSQPYSIKWQALELEDSVTLSFLPIGEESKIFIDKVQAKKSSYTFDQPLAVGNTKGKLILQIESFEKGVYGTDTSATFTLKVPRITNTVEKNKSSSLTFYPNPAQHTLYLKSNNGSKSISGVFKITDRTGKQVKSGGLTDNKIDLRGLTAGVYILHSITLGERSPKRILYMKV